MSYLFFIVVLLFAVIHLVEVSAFFARAAGVLAKKTALGYALQNSVFMLTRVFTMALFPLLGFVVDSRVGPKEYIFMVGCSLVFAAILGGFVVYNRAKVISAFVLVVNEYADKGNLFLRLLFFPKYLFSRGLRLYSLGGSFVTNDFFFFGGFVVFGVYSISVFLAFYFGLVFFDYRATISQLSGVTNALATVVLTFYIEPKLSVAIDKMPGRSLDHLATLMFGRVVGTFSFGLLFFLVYFFVGDVQ